MQFFIEDFFGKCGQLHNFLQIWSHLLKKSLIENFIFCAVLKGLGGSLHGIKLVSQDMNTAR